MSKYKYYFRKPKSEIVKDIFLWLAFAGVVAIAAASPYFTINILKAFAKGKRYARKKVYDTFYQLRKQGYIGVKQVDHTFVITLTKEGRKKAGRLQIDSLRISKPKKWDGQFRLVIFDIAQLKTPYRNAFRGKLKELGFYPFQKSVWIHPYECRDEIEVLKDFFGLSNQEVCLITAKDADRSGELKEKFGLK